MNEFVILGTYIPDTVCWIGYVVFNRLRYGVCVYTIIINCGKSVGLEIKGAATGRERWDVCAHPVSISVLICSDEDIHPLANPQGHISLIRGFNGNKISSNDLEGVVVDGERDLTIRSGVDQPESVRLSRSELEF